MAVPPNGMTTGGGEVLEHEEDSELLCELFCVLENHGVPEGLRNTIMDIIGRWEMEQPEGGDVIKLPTNK